jgi:hypothetical protein
MRFDGMNFRRNHSLVSLPATGVYVCFGRVCHADTEGAIRTKWTFANTTLKGKKGDPVYAKPLKITGNSLTNMAYGVPSYRKAGYGKVYRQPVYLMFDGVMWSTSHEVSKYAYERGQKNAHIPKEILNLETLQ